MKRRQAIKISSLGAIGFSASINTVCANNAFSFNHGVASGDPTEERVILWTRVTPKKVGTVRVVLEISEKEDFSKVVFKSVILFFIDRYCLWKQTLFSLVETKSKTFSKKR